MPRILLIEPDRLLAEVYRQALETDGHHVEVCASAQSGVLVADRKRPDIVITELQLVEHSGIEFLYEFRSYPDWQEVPIIIHSHVPPSEFNDNGDLLRSQLNIQTYLYKPQTDLAKLKQVVKAKVAAAV